MSISESLDRSSASAPTDPNAELAIAASKKAASGAISAGDRAPLFNLNNSDGGVVALEDLLLDGPVIVQFRRGAWCSYGDEGSTAISANCGAFSAEGASIVAIEPPCELARPRRNTAIPVLLDADMKASRSYGLAFELPQSLRAYYSQLGYRPPQTIERNTWLVPLPATYVIDRDGIVIFSYIDVDYRNYCDCDALLDTVKAIQGKRAYSVRNSLVASPR
jgi:peroxiredoxin